MVSKETGPSERNKQASETVKGCFKTGDREAHTSISFPVCPGETTDNGQAVLAPNLQESGQDGRKSVAGIHALN